jgi:hypothetical protein
MYTNQVRNVSDTLAFWRAKRLDAGVGVQLTIPIGVLINICIGIYTPPHIHEARNAAFPRRGFTCYRRSTQFLRVSYRFRGCWCSLLAVIHRGRGQEGPSIARGLALFVTLCLCPDRLELNIIREPKFASIVGDSSRSKNDPE